LGINKVGIMMTSPPTPLHEMERGTKGERYKTGIAFGANASSYIGNFFGEDPEMKILK
jgi:hypothetical protein